MLVRSVSERTAYSIVLIFPRTPSDFTHAALLLFPHPKSRLTHERWQHITLTKRKPTMDHEGQKQHLHDVDHGTNYGTNFTRAVMPTTPALINLTTGSE